MLHVDSFNQAPQQVHSSSSQCAVSSSWWCSCCKSLSYRWCSSASSSLFFWLKFEQCFRHLCYINLFCHSTPVLVTSAQTYWHPLVGRIPLLTDSHLTAATKYEGLGWQTTMIEQWEGNVTDHQTTMYFTWPLNSHNCMVSHHPNQKYTRRCYWVSNLIIYLLSCHTFTPIEKRAINFFFKIARFPSGRGVRYPIRSSSTLVTNVRVLATPLSNSWKWLLSCVSARVVYY